MSGSGSTTAEAPAPAPFLVKTWNMLEDPANHEHIWWADDVTVAVRKPDDLAKYVLPKYFKHSNFCSFVRQLNTYGFKKVEANPNSWEFRHEEGNFRRGAKQLLLEIKRKAPNKRNADNTVAGREGDEHETSPDSEIHGSIRFNTVPEPVTLPASKKINAERDELVAEVASLQQQHKQTMNLLVTLINEVRDTKQKVKEMQRRYGDLSRSPPGAVYPEPAPGYEYVLVKKEHSAPSEPPTTPSYLKPISTPNYAYQSVPAGAGAQPNGSPLPGQLQQHTATFNNVSIPATPLSSYVSPSSALYSQQPYSPLNQLANDFQHSLTDSLDDDEAVLRALNRQEDVLEQLLVSSPFSPAFQAFAEGSDLSFDSSQATLEVSFCPGVETSVENLADELKNLSNTGS